MKKYSEYMNEITSDELFDKFLGYGLFAEKLPSFLTSKQFLDYYKTLETYPPDKPKDYVRYLNIRNINIPRPLAIPEPFAYANQIKYLSDNWDKIQSHFASNTSSDPFKISRIHIRKMIDKNELFEMNYKNFSKDGEPEDDIVIQSRFVAKADVANCFGSIYSHSIAWALVGKEEAKSHSGVRYGNLWYNQIDKSTQQIKYGETNGILIGPHTSNLVSEIILVKVDKELAKKGYKFVRNIDDYTCYIDSYELAESFFIDLSEELKNYELSLNSKKSQIKSLPHANVKHWITKLNHFNFLDTYESGGKHYIKVKELKGFLDFAIELMLEENSDASILNYAIQILSEKNLGFNAIDYYLKQIHHLVLLYPYLTVYLDEYVFIPHGISKTDIKKIADDLYNLGTTKRIYETCSYSIYWAIKYKFRLSKRTLRRDSLASLDCIFMLVSYLYHNKYNSKDYLKVYENKAKELANSDFNRYWLFIYEVLKKEDLKAFYKNMKLKKITFVKEKFRKNGSG